VHAHQERGLWFFFVFLFFVCLGFFKKKKNNNNNNNNPFPSLDASAAVSTVTCTSLHLFTVGEGTVQGLSVLTLKLVNCALSIFEVAISGGGEVVGVGGDGIRRWEMVRQDANNNNNNNNNNNSSSSSNASGSDTSAVAAAGSSRLLRVLLDHAVEDSYDLQVKTEMPLGLSGAGAGHVTLPCLSVRAVSRDTGMIAVTARTSVELKESATSSAAATSSSSSSPPSAASAQGADSSTPALARLTTLDVSELPRQLRDLASHPPVIAKKFHATPYSFALDVRRHRDVDVLVAVAEMAVFTVMATREGRVVVKLRMQVENTHKQFVRIAFAAAASSSAQDSSSSDASSTPSIWSASVAGEAVKPAVDADGSVLLPLRKSSRLDATSGASSVFTVELIYVEEPGAMAEARRGGGPLSALFAAGSGRGRLNFQLPAVDIPISYLAVSMVVPQDFDYGSWDGMDEVARFSRAVENFDDEGSNIQLRQRGMQSQAQVHAPMSNMICQDAIELPTSSAGAMGGGDRASGVLPVAVVIKPVGREFRFEKSLHVHDTVKLSVDYQARVKKQRNDMDKRRRQQLWLLSIVGGIAAVGYYTAGGPQLVASWM
jgi:hypothetical protein